MPCEDEGATVKFSLDSEGDDTQTYSLAVGDENLRAGRSKTCDILVDISNISNQHAEFKAIPDGKGGARLVVIDKSSNGTGMQVTDDVEAEALGKGVETIVPHGSTIILPWKITATKGHTRKALKITIEGAKSEKKAKKRAARSPAIDRSKSREDSPAEKRAGSSSVHKSASPPPKKRQKEAKRESPRRGSEKRRSTSKRGKDKEKDKDKKKRSPSKKKSSKHLSRSRSRGKAAKESTKAKEKDKDKAKEKDRDRKRSSSPAKDRNGSTKEKTDRGKHKSDRRDSADADRKKKDGKKDKEKEKDKETTKRRSRSRGRTKDKEKEAAKEKKRRSASGKKEASRKREVSASPPARADSEDALQPGHEKDESEAEEKREASESVNEPPEAAGKDEASEDGGKDDDRTKAAIPVASGKVMSQPAPPAVAVPLMDLTAAQKEERTGGASQQDESGDEDVGKAKAGVLKPEATKHDINVSGASTRDHGDDAEKGAAKKLPFALGDKLQWYSASQKKLCPVRVTKISEKSRVVVVTFEENSAVWKSVPFSLLGQPDCPLRKPQVKRSHTGVPDMAVAAAATNKPRSRSATPDWKELEKQKMQKMKDNEEAEKAEIEKAIAAEEERLKQEAKRKEMIEAEKRKVEAAFEKRKKEAEEQARREEEEWRAKLVAERELESALCEAEEAREAELEEKEREERKKRRAEEKKDKKKRQEAEDRRREAEEEKERRRRQAEAQFEQTCNAGKPRVDVPAATAAAAAAIAAGRNFAGVPLGVQAALLQQQRPQQGQTAAWQGQAASQWPGQAGNPSMAPLMAAAAAMGMQGKAAWARPPGHAAATGPAGVLGKGGEVPPGAAAWAAKAAAMKGSLSAGGPAAGKGLLSQHLQASQARSGIHSSAQSAAGQPGLSGTQAGQPAAQAAQAGRPQLRVSDEAPASKGYGKGGDAGWDSWGWSGKGGGWAGGSADNWHGGGSWDAGGW
eukprot:TRINITY_DN511_c0_g1_i1.p1 TRINITY_DN511_c0_g1~~TRINITY_DN511_c0_g1_i1.p1  ORF type:complete len:969 (+),score=340.64 TRINITY_DN511_c0_g1_i1:81-2987(+)